MLPDDSDSVDGAKRWMRTPTTMAYEPLPLVCIATTAGTGGEADQRDVAANEKISEKTGVSGCDSLLPVLSVIDAERMLSVTPKFTAYQGFDRSPLQHQVYRLLNVR
jgi:alcohol dehydrogenase class IV